MRAVVCRAFGPPESLTVEELPARPLPPRHLRIAVHAAGVNFMDTLQIEGKYQEKPPFPFTPGGEIAGIVSEIGEGVSGFSVGDRVMGLGSGGGFADEAILDADAAMKIPAKMEFAIAAGFPVVYGTSHGALDWKARLRKGETLLVHGAAGGVGLTAVEVGKAMGATVVATASSREKLDVARAHGADHLIDYTTENFREKVKELTGGKGVDVVYDPVGGDVFEQSLRCIAWGGRLVVIGFAAGKIQQIPANLLLVKNCDALGFYWGSYRKFNPALLKESFATLFRWFEQGLVKPHVSHRLDLSDTATALNLLKTRKATGKVVLTTGR